MSATPRLIADIGGTNARFALVDGSGAISAARVLASDDYPDLRAAIEAYCGELGVKPRIAALAVASPVTGDRVTLTNHPWSFSRAGLERELGLERLVVVNDFTAIALAIPHLAPEDAARIGGGTAVAGAPIAALGPGTGLGVSALVAAGTGWIALAGEGGHATMAAADEHEAAVLERLRRRFDHVSGERLLSGQGLVNLYETLAELAGEPARSYTPAQIADPAIGEAEPLAKSAIEMFCAMLGTVAGNLALTLGARGGVYIAGGIVPKLGSRFAGSQFRERFEAKGRMRSYLVDIPTAVVTHPFPAFLGLARA